MIWRRDKSFAERENMQHRGSSDSRATADSHCAAQGGRNEMEMFWQCSCRDVLLIWLVKVQERVKRVDTFVRDKYQSASITGKARLLDGSTQHGPSAWHVRMPKAGRFRYLERESDPLSARAADLLACPPHHIGKDCLSCSFQPGLDRVPLGTDARHYVHCRKGLRLHGAVSDKVRDELCFILERCGIRLIAERPQSHRQMLSFRQREGAFLMKTPDLVLPCFDAPRSFTVDHSGHQGY